MKSLSVLFLCGVCLLPSPAVRAQGLVLSEDFENGAPGWTFTHLWHIESETTPCGVSFSPLPSPTHCAWYGSAHTVGTTLACDYAALGSQSGDLVSPPILLPQNPGSLVLRYRRTLDSEFCIEGYDTSGVHITTPGSTSILLYASDCALEVGWSDRRVDLGAFAGSTVQIHFSFQPQDSVFNELLGWAIDDVEITTEPGSVNCVASPACPCSGQQLGGLYVLHNEDSGGCRNSLHKEARLFGNGSASVAADTVGLVVHDMRPNTVALFVQGLTTTGTTTFGDGRRCVGGPFVRLALHAVPNDQDVYPRAGEAGVAVQGAVPAAGGTRTYQVVYRDAASYCTSSTFNTSNGYVIVWQP